MTFRFIIALILLAALSFAQSGIRFEKYDIRDGLSQTIVNCLEQDEDGFLWVGTQDGLNRFDGYDFEVFKPDPFDENSISDNYINDLLLDSKNNLWVATESGLNIYSKANNKFVQVDFPVDVKFSIQSAKIRHLQETENGSIWLATQNHGLIAVSSYNLNNRKFILTRVKDPQLEGADIYSTFEFYNQLYISTSKGLYIYALGRVLPVTMNGKHFQEKLYKFSKVDDEIWAATTQGAIRIKLTESELEVLGRINEKMGLSSNEVNDIYHDKDFFWIATEKGLTQVNVVGNDTVCYNIEAKELSRYNEQGTQVSCFLLDRYGSLWIGTDRGMNRFDEKVAQFKLFRSIPNRSNSLMNNTIWTFDAVKNKVYVGTTSGISVLDKRRGTFKNYTYKNSDVPNASVSNIFIDSKERLWLSSGDESLLLLNRNTLKSIGKVNYLPDSLNRTGNRTYTILEDSKGRFWIGGQNGLSILNKDLLLMDHFLPNNHEYALSHRVIRHVFEDTKGNIWIATDGGGLNRVIEKEDGSFEFEVFQYNRKNEYGLTHNMVLSVTQDFYGNIWCATYGGGVNKYVPSEKRFYHITEKNGLSNNVVYGVVRDGKGNIWASTNKGLSEINPKDHSVRVYTERSGLQSDEFNIGAFHITDENEVLFGGINGFNLFNPNDISSNITPPDLAFTRVSIFNKPLDISQYRVEGYGDTLRYEIDLKSTENSISFDFVGIHFSSPKDNWYRFKLENFQDDWVVGKNRRFANYSNLDYGEYVFKVTAANSDRIWNNKYAEFRVNIAPPVYHTWWFRIAGALLLIGILFAVYYSRLAMIRTQKRLLEQKVTARTQKVLEQKKKIEGQKKLIEEEKHKAEKLLLNILPEETARELITEGKASPRHYRLSTVMFCDFKGFTKIAERLEPQALIDELDYCFNAFDDIMEKYNLEKIKTSGDAYMAAGGLPIRNKTNPIDMVLAAIEIQQFMRDHKKMKESLGKEAWELRIGIHTGEAIAGVVGKKKFAYDIWGDTVNTAARMESSSETDKINISGSTYEFVKDYFDVSYRGKIPAKNKGEVDMYYVNGIKKELSIDGKGLEPNNEFKRILNFNVFSRINYNRVRKYLLTRLENDLPKNLHYHGVHHTRDVIAAAERIAISEGMDEETTLLIKTAALFHDAGFLRKYWKNEPQGVELAREILPQHDFTEEQIDLIEQMILATAVPQKPKNIYEEILCDADLDYLGRDDFEEISQTLCSELIEYGKIKSAKEWDAIQVKFLKKHVYFTKTNIRDRREKKLAHLERVKERLKDSSK